MKEKDITAVDRIDKSIKALEDKSFNIFFFVVDSKNVPNSSMEYVYEMALTLKNSGFNVTMLYQLGGAYTQAELHRKKKLGKNIDYTKVFTGVGEWLGEEYAKIQHMNVSSDEWVVSPSDILFIPEAFSSLMFETYKHKAPCKRVVLLQNFQNVTDFIPVGVEWKNYGILDVVASTKKQEELIKSVFPYVHTKVLNPMINPMYRKPVKPKKLLVNIIAPNQRVVNMIVKNFYWKYPMYKFISFVDLRGLPREEFSEKLKEGFVTVWVDSETTFGYSALEAIKSGNILIGKVPDTIPEWMVNSDGSLSDCGIWTYDTTMMPDLISKVVGSWMQNEIPEELNKSMDGVSSLYSIEEWNKNVLNVVNEIIDEQKKTFTSIKTSILEGENNKEEEK